MTTLHFVSAPGGSTFMHELLSVIAGEVRALGPEVGVEDVTVTQGTFPSGDEAVFVVEPHEFFLKTAAPDQPTRDQLARTIAICVEHPGTASFAQTVETARRVAARMDINDDSTFALNELGMPTERFHLGYSEQWDVWGGADSVRTHDVLFLGTIDPRRSRNIALDVGAVDDASLLLAMPPHEPMNRPRPDFITGREKLDLLADAKVIVNLHRERSRSFEWVRALEAMCNGCVVVSEHSTDFAPLTPGHDVLFGSSRSLFTFSRTLLHSPDRLADMRAACYETLRNRMSMAQSARRLAELAADLAAGIPPRRPQRAGARPGALAPSPSYGLMHGPDGDPLPEDEPGAARVDGGLFPLPLVQSRPALPAGARPDRSADSLDVLILRSCGWPEFARPLAALLPQLAGMDSVVYLCLDGVREDAGDVAQNVVVLPPDSAMGPGTARNAAVELSDAAQILVLNSTDALLPHAVERLRRALDESDAGAAYGMVVTADGLITSAHPYERDRLERTDYLAAASLWRRSALVAAGGWYDGAGWQGQEVRDLWWRHGTDGASATLVPRPLVRQAPVQRVGVGGAPQRTVDEPDRDRGWELARSLDVSPRVHPDDFIFRFLAEHPEIDGPLEHYLSDGRASAELLARVLDDAGIARTASFDFLEFASGYGCVSRHIASVLPGARVVASDIHPQAMRFLRDELGVGTALSTTLPGDFDAGGRFDVVFALSFFSHMPERTWSAWLEALYRHVRPGGVLLFTTHGEESRRQRLPQAELNADGFWFSPESEQGDLLADDYGSTVTTREYVRRQVQSRLGTDVSGFSEGFWWKHQDLYVVRKPRG